MQQFVDEVRLSVASGAGGAGSVSFLRQKYVPRGGPDGGDGGRGGDVRVVVKPDLRTLVHLTRTRRVRAERGQGGMGRNRHGRDGQDAVVEVPPGTAIYDADTGELLFDALRAGDVRTLLSGGRGGKGNAHFATSRNQAPRFAQPGEPGRELELRVELRLIADVGLVGQPNAGKSSLLGRLTAAHPRIGAYPFTTKTPNLGVLELEDLRLVIADLPGLIEGASRGAGLGITFLRHVARTRLIAFVLDLSRDSPLEDLRVLERELHDFNEELSHRPHLVIGNKLDLPGSAERLVEVRSALRVPVAGVSALSGEGVRPLAGLLLRMAGEAA